MKLKSLLILLFWINVTLLPAQQQISWEELSKLTYVKKMDELMGFKVDVPVFDPSVKEFDGKKIRLRGYIIPVEGYKNQNEFVFSAYPYNMCFFCGNAGPETVMEVRTKKPIKYVSEAVTLEGILHLNETDINSLMFSLEEAMLAK